MLKDKDETTPLVKGSKPWVVDRLSFKADYEGYLNLSRLISRSYQEGQHQGIPQVERNWFIGLTDGLIAMSGGRNGDVAK